VAEAIPPPRTLLSVTPGGVRVKVKVKVKVRVRPWR